MDDLQCYLDGQLVFKILPSAFYPHSLFVPSFDKEKMESLFVFLSMQKHLTIFPYPYSPQSSPCCF